MSLGSCLVSNEMSGQAEAFIQARIEGKSWAQIADEFNLPNPGAARKAFQKATGISDFKIKGQELANLVKQGPDALKAVNEAKAAAKKVKALDDVVPKKTPIDVATKQPVPQAQQKTVKDWLHKHKGYTDDDFDTMLNSIKHGASKLDVADVWNISPGDFDDLMDVWKAEGKLGIVPKIEPPTASPFNYTTIKDNVLEAMPEEKLQELHKILSAEKDDVYFKLEAEKNSAKQKYMDYLDKFEGTPDYDESKVESLLNAFKAKNKELKTYSETIYPKIEDDLLKIDKLITKKPVSIPDIPANQPVKNKFTSDVNIGQKTGLTPSQVDKIIELNNQGKFYSDIKSAVPGVDFAQIDEVVWNELLKKHNGFTWRAYTEKPTSETGFNAVKEKVFEARKKGLTVDEIVGKPGAPPKTVVQAILDDKWKLPSPGTKVPIIPPPPPPPPQVFGGTIPSSTGVNFRRHGNDEMLDWIRPDTASLNAGQRKAITSYTNSGYHDINSYLRGGGLTDTQGYGYTGSNITKTIENLDATMRPLPVDTIVTRNFSGVQHLPAAPQDMVGLVYHDNAFLSTTVKEAGVFSGDVQLIIHCPQGTMARYVNDISIHKSEEELLLARGTRMVVTKVEKHGDGYSTRWRLFCEVIAG